ncbi:hypothetical protein [Arvimicrobium flavum]|uniref:hypothetical protein n=1 Tax=Arvimicrobium flavum TaxID=3393320 RepID=UPI00237AF51B|nr:hypothetical protein [Mesorhizobium shangrilense]
MFCSGLSRAAETSLAVGIAALLLALIPNVSFAHDAIPTAAQPQGWSYPFACCSNFDCRMVSSKSISERPEGYMIKDTGEVVSYADARIKQSPDGEFHWCSVAGEDRSRTICLFVPPRGY